MLDLKKYEISYGDYYNVVLGWIENIITCQVIWCNSKVTYVTKVKI